MNAEFPETYSKPRLMNVFDAAVAGWSAKCASGPSATFTTLECRPGHGNLTPGCNPTGAAGGFLTPEQMQQGGF
jgi:hypothetical protein